MMNGPPAKEKLPFKETETVLTIMDPYLDLEDLGVLKNKDTIKDVHLDMEECYDEAPFDIGALSDFAKKHLPKLHTLSMFHTPIGNFRLESKTLKNLYIEWPGHHGIQEDKKWVMKCPNLVYLSMEAFTPPLEKFQQSLFNCPLIETFYCHKGGWAGPGNPLPTFYLPSCTEFTFRRGDMNRSLALYLPKVKDLILDACYDLESLELLTEGHPKHAEWNPAPGDPLSKFHLSLTSAIVSNQVRKSLRDSGRVSNPEEIERDDYKNFM